MPDMTQASPVPAIARAAPAPRVVLTASAGVLVLALTVTGLVLQIANGGAVATNGRDYVWGLLVASAAFGLPGTLLALRGTAPRIGWVALGIGLSLALGAAAVAWSVRTLDVDPGSLPAAGAAAWLAAWCWVPGICAIPTLLLLLLPDGRLPSSRWRAVAAAAAGAIVANTASVALRPYVLDELPPAFASRSNPFEVASLADPLSVVGTVLLVPSAALALASLVLRYRGATGERRDQLKWVALGGAATLVLLQLARLDDDAGNVVLPAAMVPLPASVAIAVLRHRMWDVNVVIRRSLVYGVLTAAVVAAYVGVVSLVGELVERTVAGVVAAALVAVGLQPAHRRVQRVINQLVYGDRDDPGATLRRLGERLVAAGEGEEALQAVAVTVARALRLPYVAVRVPDAPGGEHGTPSGALVTIDLLYRGEPVGELVAAPREQRTGFSRADRRALETIGRQVAVAAHSARLSQDLRRSRERLVLAREEERRRLRRDLHDELGPALAALALELETVRDRARAHPAQTDATLARAAEWAREGVADVRRLVYDLRPPTLDDLGLADAVREQTQRLTTSRLAVSVQAPPDLGRLSAAVEAAAYRIVSEALTNAVRHSGGATCEVIMSVEGGALHLLVRDDGSGISDSAQRGVGLASMRERAEELGGAFAMAHAAGGGTEMRASLPLGQR